MTKQSIILLSAVCIICGCRTQYVPVETVRTEYKDRLQEINTVDSVSSDRLIYIKGDTTYISQVRERWKTKTVHDSIHILHTDTIRVPYSVEKKQTAMEKVKTGIGIWGVAVTVIAIIMLAINIKSLTGRFRQ